MRDIVEAKRKPARLSGDDRRSAARHLSDNITARMRVPRVGLVGACVGSVASLLVFACAPPAATQEPTRSWVSAGGHFQIDFAGNGLVEIAPPYSAPEVLARAETRSGTAGCELSVLLLHAPPGSQERVNTAIRSISDDMSRLESADARDYRLTVREVDSVALVESTGRYANSEGMVTRFGLYHDGAINMYTLSCMAAANDADGIASIRPVAGSLRFLNGDTP